MGKKKIQYIVLIVIVILLGALVAYFYTGFNGYPWKHAEIKRESIKYMKDKYNMDVKVAGSSFNFKFDYYTAEVFNINDKNKTEIRVERQKFYDENNLSRGERLEDNYREIYWEVEINKQLHQKFAKFYELNDIETSSIDIPYFTAPIGAGVSTLKDEYGVVIPLAPDYNPVLDVDLKSNEFSDELLQGLLVVIRDLMDTESRIDIVVSGKYEAWDTYSERKKTKYLDLPFEKLKEIQTVEDLKNEISEY